MAFTPYDWNQAIQTRSEYIEERLREGSPVAALSLPGGILLASVHQAPRKVYEIYDRLAFAGLGNQADVEAIRNASLDFAHREGFQRSPDDVTAHRLVGSVLAPVLKRAFGDPFTAPLVFRGLFAELGETAEQDAFYTLGFDGEFRRGAGYCAVSGDLEAEDAMTAVLAAGADSAGEIGTAVRLALDAWATGRRAALRRGDDASPVEDVLREALTAGVVEAGWLERDTTRESRFRLLTEAELAAGLPDQG